MVLDQLMSNPHFDYIERQNGCNYINAIHQFTLPSHIATISHSNCNQETLTSKSYIQFVSRYLHILLVTWHATREVITWRVLLALHSFIRYTLLVEECLWRIAPAIHSNTLLARNYMTLYSDMNSSSNYMIDNS